MTASEPRRAAESTAAVSPVGRNGNQTIVLLKRHEVAALSECQRPLRREPGLCGMPEHHPFHRRDAASYLHQFVGIHGCQANGCRLDAVTEMAFKTGDRRIERRYCADHAESMMRAIAGMPG